jgi:hypothetical protein
MHWVIKEVLDQKMNIDQGFLRALKRARRPVHYRANGDAIYVKQVPKTVAYLRQWYDVCSRRREAQMLESKVFGRKLVNLLAWAANKDSSRLTTARRNRRRQVLRSGRSERPDRSSSLLSGNQRDLRVWKPSVGFEFLEGSELPEHFENVERPECVERSEHSEQLSPPAVW